MRRKIFFIWPILFLLALASTRTYPVGSIHWVDLFETVSTYRFDWARSGRMPYAGPAAAREEWSFSTSKNIFSSPVVDRLGRIYFGSQDDFLYCLDHQGRALWKYQTGGDVDSTPSIGPDGTVYVGSDDDFLYAIGPDGKLKWRYNAGNDIRSSPLILPQNVVVFTTYGGQVLAVQNGNLLWKADLYGGWSNASPAWDEGRNKIYVTSSGGTVAAFSPSGSTLWQTMLYVRIQAGTVALDRDGNLYVSTHNGLFSFSPEGRRRFVLGQIVSMMAPAVNFANEVVLVDRAGVYWRVSTTGDILAQQKVASGESFAAMLVDSANNMYFGSRDDNLYAIRPDGSLIFKMEIGKDVDSSPALSPRGTLYFGADTGRMTAIGAR